MDHATLGDTLRNTSAAEAATLSGVCRRTIYRWCKQNGIPRRIYRCPDVQLLRRLEDDGVLQKEIARAFGVSRWTIWRWCVRFGIAHHTTRRFRKGTKGNIPHIHEQMPFGVGVLFDLAEDWEVDAGTFNF
jgi:predicted DNA-binding transcriptional regulator AlpA